VVAVAAELGHVHSGAEGRSGAGQHDASDAVVLAEVLEGLAQLDPEVDRQRVALLRPLQGDKRYFVAAFDREQARHRGDVDGRRHKVSPQMRVRPRSGRK
jgi:hypothetical protein